MTTCEISFDRELAVQFQQALERHDALTPPDGVWTDVALMTLAGCIQAKFCLDGAKMLFSADFASQPSEHQEAILTDHRAAVNGAMQSCSDFIGMMHAGRFQTKFQERVSGIVQSSGGKINLFMAMESYRDPAAEGFNS